MTADPAWWGAGLGAAGGIVLVVAGLSTLAAGRGAVTALVGVVAVAAATVGIVVAGQLAGSPDAASGNAAIGVGAALAAAGIVPWLLSDGGVLRPGLDVGMLAAPLLVGAGTAMTVAGWRGRQADR